MVIQISRYTRSVAMSATLLLSVPGLGYAIGSSDAPPPMELLEYLGNLAQTEDGFIGPEYFDDEIPDESIQRPEDDAQNTTDEISAGRASDHD